jgi:hypothetical protein
MSIFKYIFVPVQKLFNNLTTRASNQFNLCNVCIQVEPINMTCVRVSPVTVCLLSDHKQFPPHTQFSPFALIDYTRAITPIRGWPYGDFCRAFDAEKGRSPLFFYTFIHIIWVILWHRHDITEILLKVALNTINHHSTTTCQLPHKPFQFFIDTRKNI